MNNIILTEYTERIYKFSLSKTFSEDEAEELSQEILINAVRSLPKLRDESRFEPWLWSLAQNTARVFRRKQSKQRAMFVYDAPEYLLKEDEEIGFEDSEKEEAYSLLREKISMLSRIYRDIIIFHYYDGLSVKEISERLNIPMGTVTWRLSEARNRLKKGVNDMEATALKPVKLGIGIYGSGNYNGEDRLYPGQLIDDALSQNILFHCYDSPKSVEELAKLCGVPAYYIEDRIEMLERRQAIIQPSKGKYRTDFIFWEDKHGKYCEDNVEAALMPVMGKLVSALERLWQEADKIDFYRAEKTDEELKYLYGIMAMDHLSEKYNDMEYPPILPNYDDYKWRYVGYAESGKYRRIHVGNQRSTHEEYNGENELISAYTHFTYGFADIKLEQMMYKQYIEVCLEILEHGKTKPDWKNAPACAARDGYIRIKDNVETVLVPYFTKEQKERFDALAEEIFSPLMEEYKKAVKDFTEGYKKLFPTHLYDDAQRMCHGFFLDFFDTVARYCIKNGILKHPESDWRCSVLVKIK